MASWRAAAVASLKQHTLKAHTFNINIRYLNCEPVVNLSLCHMFDGDHRLEKMEVPPFQLRPIELLKDLQGTMHTGSQRDQENGGGDIQIRGFDLGAQPREVL